VKLDKKMEEHKSIHCDIETKGKCIRLVLKYCKWLADEHQTANPTHQELVQTVPLLTRKAKNFEHRWQLLYIRSLEWICFIESLTVKKCRKDSNSSSDCDEEPVHKCPRLVDHKLSYLTNNKYDSCEMETETSPSPVLQSERISFDDTANFHKSDRKGPNLATFYYKHLDTDSEQESQKKFVVESEVKTSESSEEEWIYSTNKMTEVKNPDVHVSLAERANLEEIKALVENVNWSVSKNKNPDKLWISGSGVKKRNFKHDNFNSENEEFIADSCDASGEYTTEDDDQHFSSDNHSHLSQSCDITIMQSTDLDFSSNPGHINDYSPSKVVLRSKTNSGNSLRPVSMSGLPQSTPKARFLTESCHLSVSESALNQISHEQVSVNGRDSSTIEESTATQTQDCCGSFNTNSLRRRKLKHRRKSTMERKSKSGSADSLSSVVNSITSVPYNEITAFGSFSGSLCGIPQNDSQRMDSETEEETAKDSKRPTTRKRPIKMPVFRLGEFGAVTPREKRFPLTTQLPSGTTDFSSFSEQAWDSYQEKYLSEPYSEDPPDPDSVRRLLDFGDDYRKYIDSQSDCASSIGRPSCLDDETFEQDSSDSVRKLIIRSRLQLNYFEQVLSKLVTYPSSNLTITEINQLRQWCRENEYCLRFCLEEIKDNKTCVSTNDKAELESMVKKCERLELDISKQEKIQLLKTDIAAIKSHLLSFTPNDQPDSNVQNKNELQVLIHTAKTELSNLELYWNNCNKVSITEELNRQFNESNDANAVLRHLNKEVADLYSIYTNAKQRLDSDISRYQNALITWVECDKQLMELEMKFKGFGDDGGVRGNPKSGGFGSASDSGMSDSGSEHELNEHEKRLINLKQLANNLMTIMTPGNEALSSILVRIENNEKQLKELQQTCKDLIGRTEINHENDKLDGNKYITDTNIVDTTAENPKTPLKKIKDNTALLWRTLRIAVPFYLAVMILCSIGWLEPQCCDLQNNYKWSFALGLRYMNGPPPT